MDRAPLRRHPLALPDAARDLFVPQARDVEVWFGFELRGAAARWSAPLHWAIFAFGAWACWTARPWLPTAAAAYTFYVALSHLVWSEVSPNGHGWLAGLAQAAAISVPGWLLLRVRRALKQSGPPSISDR